MLVVEATREGFGHGRAPRDSDMREAEQQVVLSGQASSLVRYVGHRFAGQPPCGMSCRVEGEVFFDSLQNHVAEIGADNAGA
ncbi:MAG: hypothetical protein OXI64_05850 [Defluviicoccus sp.]|nr:hypothetical protein [Defluviicoccus sp.]